MRKIREQLLAFAFDRQRIAACQHEEVSNVISAMNKNILVAILMPMNLGEVNSRMAEQYDVVVITNRAGTPYSSPG